MAKYFTIDELCKTTTNLNNIPDADISQNLSYFIETVLDDLREKWGSAIRVNSAYRSEEVNNAVGGSKTSAHLLGWAVDIEPCNGKMKEFQEFIPNYFKQNSIQFDQIILEKPKNGIASWVHIGLYNSKGEQRNQIFRLI